MTTPRHDRRRQASPPFEALESRLALAADFTVSVDALFNDYDQRRQVDVIRLNATVQNVGDRNFFGRGEVEFYLSLDQTFDDSDRLFATETIQRMPRLGLSTRVRLDVPEPALLDPAEGDPVSPNEYFIIARVVAGNGTLDENPGNDTASTFASASILYEFGTINNRNVPFSYTQSDGTRITLRLDGPGAGNLAPQDGRILLVVTGTTERSTLRISTDRAGRTAEFGQINIPGSLKEILAERVVMTGTLTVGGSVGYVRLGGLQNGQLQISGFSFSQSLDLGDVRDAVVSSGSFIDSLSVSRWINTDQSPDVLEAAFISGISSNGDFHPNVTLATSNSNSQSIDSARIRGSVGGLWNIASSIGFAEFGSTLPSFRATVNGIVETFRTRRDFQGILAAPLIITLDVGRDMLGARVLAGATLGSDVDLGGAGTNADSFRNGSFQTILVRGRMVNSLVAAGLFTDDAILLDDDDRLIISGDAGSVIQNVEVRRDVTNSVFVAPTVPSVVRINNRDVNTEGDQRFIIQVPVPEGTVLPNFDPIAPPPPVSDPGSGGSGGSGGSSGGDSSTGGAVSILRRLRGGR